MNIKQLKALIAKLPDDMEVVVSGSDHSYSLLDRGSKVVKAEVEYKGRSSQIKHLWEYYDKENKTDPRNLVIDVFWIDDRRY